MLRIKLIKDMIKLISYESYSYNERAQVRLQPRVVRVELLELTRSAGRGTGEQSRKRVSFRINRLL